jgi:hypothetical protein
MKKLLFAMALGAGLAWLFDPDAGSRRRASLKRKIDKTGLTAPAGRPPAAPTVVSTNHTPAAVATIP